MKILEIISQHRRDFVAIYQCEHCDATERSTGYDDTHFHQNVIPDMECKTCGKTAPETYRPLAPKYNDGQVV